MLQTILINSLIYKEMQNYIWENIMKFSWYIFPVIKPYIICVSKIMESWHLHFFAVKPMIIEPTTSEWINICSLVIITKKYQLVNTNLSSSNLSSSSSKKEYYSFYKTFYSNYDYLENKETEENNAVTKEHLFIAKMKNNKYICKVCFPKHVKNTFSEGTEEGTEEDEKIEKGEMDTTLLYVEYSHPKMNMPIGLPFTNNMLRLYNELFTPAFVLRQLQTQTSESYYFDMDYTLTILDSNLKRIHLNSSQYIFCQPNPDNYLVIQR